MERFSARAKQASGATDSLLIDWLNVISDGRRMWSSLLPNDVFELTQQSERGFDSNGGQGPACGHIVVPTARLLRDLNVGTPSAGGALVGAPVSNHTAALRDFSAVAQAGARVITLEPGESPVGVPYTAAPFEATVAPVDGAVVEREAVIGLRKNQMSTLGFHFGISRRLLRQGGPAADRLLRTEMVAAIARGIDRAALAGSGDPAQPLGLGFGSGSGVHSIAPGTAFGWGDVQGILFSLANGATNDENIRFIASPAVRFLLMQRGRSGTERLIWDDRKIAGYPAHVSLGCPANSLFAGDFTQLAVVQQGGISISVTTPDPAGSVRVVVMVDIDIFPLHASAFSVAKDIT